MLQYLWLALLVIFVVAECLTVGLVSIWFAGGALVAMILAAAGVGTVTQIAVFLAVSAVLLILTRPIAVKYFNSRKEKTNADAVIGTVAKVTETIDNYNQTGAAFADGKEWTARSTEDLVKIEKDALVVVEAIEGVKLMVKPYQKEESKSE